MPPVDIKDLLTEIKTDVRRVSETQTAMLQVQVRQQAILDEHVRRTEAAESSIAAIRAELAPLKIHDAVWGAAAKVIAAGGALVTIVMGLLRVFGG